MAHGQSPTFYPRFTFQLVDGCIHVKFFAWWVYFHVLLSSDFFFSKSSFSKNSFQNTIRVSNSLDADQARHVRPELDPNCLQNFQHRALVGRVKNWVDSLMVPFQSCSKT